MTNGIDMRFGLSLGSGGGGRRSRDIKGTALPGEILSTGRTGQWYVNGQPIAGETGRNLTVPFFVRPDDVISKQGLTVTKTVGGAMLSYEEGYARYYGGMVAPPITRASGKTRWDSYGKLVTLNNNALLPDFDPVTRRCNGLNVEAQATNKCTNRNVNPTSFLGMTKTGDVASTIAIVEDMAALRDAGLDQLCVSGKVYKLDNSLGTTIASCTIAGVIFEGVVHTSSAYVRGSGLGFARPGNTVGVNVALTSNYKRIYQTGAPSGGAAGMVISATAGSVIYFTLNQLEEGGMSSVIPVDGAAAVRQADTPTIPVGPAYDPTKGSFIADYSANVGSINEGLQDRRLFIFPSLSGGLELRAIRGSSTNQALIYRDAENNTRYVGVGGPVLEQEERLACSYSTVNEGVLSRRGTLSGTIPEFYGGLTPTFATLGGNLNGKVRSLLYFPKYYNATGLANFTQRYVMNGAAVPGGAMTVEHLTTGTHRLYVDGVLALTFTGSTFNLPSTLKGGEVLQLRNGNNFSNYVRVLPIFDFNPGSGVFPTHVGGQPLTFQRASSAGRFNASRVWEMVAANVPRIDYDPVTGECLGYLSESQATNLVAYSENFTNPYWTLVSGATVTAASGVSPDGTNNATKVTFSAMYSGLRVINLVTTPGQTVTVSLWVKRLSGNTALHLRGSETGVIYMQPITVTGEWVRYSATFVHNGTNGIGIHLQDRNASGQGEVLIYGAQVEVGGLSSYIPTSGAAAVRQADSLTVPTTGWFNPIRGRLNLQVKAFPGSSTYGVRRAVYFSDVGNDRLVLRLGNSSSSDRPLFGFGIGTTVLNITLGTLPVSSVEWESFVAYYSPIDGGAARKTGVGVAVSSSLTPGYTGFAHPQLIIGNGSDAHIRRLTFDSVINSSQLVEAVEL